ncbi:MAG: DUF6495 family protein [Flavobacteriaceae bacterium]
MKYTLLSKEQLEALSEDFSKFLATQQIDVKEWNTIKSDRPKVAQEELELFSDLVWDDVLSKAKYIEHISPKQLDLFNCSVHSIHRIVVKIAKDNFDFYNDADYKWFLKNLNDRCLTFFQAQKKYQRERNLELFDLIQKGGVISKGELYKNMLLKIG